MKTQVHDLLHVDLDSVNPCCPAARAWVRHALASSPWVVVRRDGAPKDKIAIGVRGATRGDRWAGFVAKDKVQTVVRPEELLLLFRSSKNVSRTPAFEALRQMDERWHDLELSWGPAGSVGFELASGKPATNESSDLDIVVRAPGRISKDRARSLWDKTRGLAVRADVRVETPQCGFALAEYASAPSTGILLRYPTGPRLGDDPWSEQETMAAIV